MSKKVNETQNPIAYKYCLPTNHSFIPINVTTDDKMVTTVTALCQKCGLVTKTLIGGDATAPPHAYDEKT